jgi:hypothetical protein
MSIHNVQEDVPPMSLHDSLALGYVELGLKSDEKTDQSEMEEMERLPVLLRLLSSSRPLSSVPTFSTKKEDPSLSTTLTPTPLIDEVATEIVARLEEVAATYSVAEGVDVVACHLAPSLCRNLAKLSPLKRKRNIYTVSTSENSLGWETAELAAVGANPRTSFKRKRGSQSPTIQHAQLVAAAADLTAGTVSEGGLATSDEEEGHANNNSPANAALKTKPSSRRCSETGDAGTEDLLEEICEKNLSDLTSLVVASLEPVRADCDMDGDSGPKGKLTLSMEDSSLSERARIHVTAGNEGVMVGSDLGSTVVALLHYAPVLRHQHVAVSCHVHCIPFAMHLIKVRLLILCSAECVVQSNHPSDFQFSQTNRG